MAVSGKMSDLLDDLFSIMDKNNDGFLDETEGLMVRLRACITTIS